MNIKSTLSGGIAAYAAGASLVMAYMQHGKAAFFYLAVSLVFGGLALFYWGKE